MGQPARGNARAPAPEHIGCEEATRGTETSQYPEEEKSTEIPRVAASERGPKPKPVHVQASGRFCTGVVAPVTGGLYRRRRGPGEERNGMGRPAAAGESPVREFPGPPIRMLSRAGHVKPGPKQGGPPSKAEHSLMTDSEPVP